VEAEGFLVESPVTWYKERKAWGMSPGYDRADHQGFERPIGEQCLVCHAGHAEALGKSLNRMQVKEPALSCERCHGPGSLHVAHRNNRKGQPLEGTDYTIVNPRHLSRTLAEAICQQCHLHSAAAVLGRGKKYADFRPGLPLKDFRQDYWLEVGNVPMTVVGHVEQMHLSRCYQQSQTLTCTTCHNPHAFPRPEERVAYYKSICVSCHKPEQCTVKQEVRLHKSPDNNCVQCHMPAAATEVPHVSSTHHRIAVHEKLIEPARPAGKPGILRPFVDYTQLGDVDKKRSLGLAYLDLAKSEKNSTLAAHYQGESLKLMSAVSVAGLRDPALEAALARLQFEQGQDQSLLLAEKALLDPDLAGSNRCTALFIVAAGRFQRKQYKDARVALHELVALRRHPDDWMLLGNCEGALGNPGGQAAALQMVVRINPRQWQVHQFLADYFRKQGDPQRAAWHQQRAVP
jgi:predicted CXXCH cytochrome family protein